MECTCIPYTRVPRSSALLVDYLYHFDRVAPFYDAPPFDLQSYRAVAEPISSLYSHRRELVDLLARQNKAFGCSEATFRNIDRLAAPGTFAVVAGQQVALLAGPAFTLYKALTAVRLAQTLSEQGLPSVPVFWLATEDHDHEEVAQVATLDDEYELVALRDAGDRPAARSSVGYVKLTAEINAALDRLSGVQSLGPSKDHLLDDLRASYRAGAAWGEAFGRLMARWFAKWGVVLIDPLDESLHRLSARIYEQAFIQSTELRGRLLERSRALIRAGYHAQVHVPEHSTLVFAARDGNRATIHQGDPDSPMKIGAGGDFLLDGIEEIPLPKLKAWVEDRPLDFSPNVLLRPVVQDALLPTVAYIAGPSELAYLGQAQTLYSLVGRPMPVAFPRAGFTLVDRRIRRLLDKYHLGLEDVWKGEEHLSGRIGAEGFTEEGAAGWSKRFDQSEQDMVRDFERLRQDMERLDPTLLDAFKHAQEKITYQVERLRSKVSRAALEREGLLRRHKESLLRFLTPRKSLQEREVGGVYFLGRAGYELLDRLLAQIQTRSSDHQVLDY